MSHTKQLTHGEAMAGAIDRIGAGYAASVSEPPPAWEVEADLYEHERVEKGFLIETSEDVFTRACAYVDDLVHNRAVDVPPSNFRAQMRRLDLIEATVRQARQLVRRIEGMD